MSSEEDVVSGAEVIARLEKLLEGGAPVLFDGPTYIETFRKNWAAKEKFMRMRYQWDDLIKVRVSLDGIEAVLKPGSKVKDLKWSVWEVDEVPVFYEETEPD